MGATLLMTGNKIVHIDLVNFPHVNGIIRKAFIKDKNFHLALESPNTTVIATIRPNYSSFRMEIEKILKEKDSDKGNNKKILNFVDAIEDKLSPDPNAEILTKTDDSKMGKGSESDISDISDTSYSVVQVVKTVNVSECIKLDKGRVQVKGSIFGLSEPYKVISSITLNCSCKDEYSEGRTFEYDPPIFVIPRSLGDKCSICNAKRIIVYKNAITVQLQDNDKFNDIQRLTCILLNMDMDNVRIGEQVNVTGNIYVIPKNNKGSLITTILVDKLDYINREQIVISDKDIEAINRFARLKGPNLIKSLTNMFDWFVIGNNMVKEGLLYGLVSTGNDLDAIKNKRMRNRINILLAGPPGLAKSTLLKKAVSLISNSRFESMQHSSSKSLTAIVLKDNEQHFLRLGPIPLSKGAVCALNEIGTMSPDDQNYLLDIMEEGKFTNNKYGFNSTIESPTTIFASTNIRDRDNDNGSFTRWLEVPRNNYDIPLLPQILDRFDLILISKDKGDEATLRKFAGKKLESQSVNPPNYDSFLQKYLLYTKSFSPELTPESAKMIEDYYIDLNRKSIRRSESKRSLDTLIRLCKAVARLNLRDTIEPEHVIHATSFYNEVVHNYQGIVALVPKDPIKTTLDACLTKFEESKEIPILFSELLESVCIENEFVKSYLMEHASKSIDNISLGLDRNRKVRKISKLLRSHPNITIVNKTPLKLQYREKTTDSFSCQKCQKCQTASPLIKIE